MAEIMNEAMEMPTAEPIDVTPTEHVSNLQVDNLNVGKVNVTNGFKTIAGGAATMVATQMLATIALQGIQRGIEAGGKFIADRKAKRLEKKQQKLEEQKQKLQRQNFRAEVEAQAEAEVSEE